jgi:protein tyrosine phosphatase domain-containing protein 1
LRKHGLLAALLSHNIRCMINLQEKGEHATCGEGNLPDGFSYSVPDFVDNGIDVHVFGWIDFGVPTMDTCLTMVKVIASAVAGGVRVAVHCHAGKLHWLLHHPCSSWAVLCGLARRLY